MGSRWGELSVRHGADRDEREHCESHASEKAHFVPLVASDGGAGDFLAMHSYAERESAASNTQSRCSPVSVRAHVLMNDSPRARCITCLWASRFGSASGTSSATRRSRTRPHCDSTVSL